MGSGIQTVPGYPSRRASSAAAEGSLSPPWRAALAQIGALTGRRPASADFHVDAGIVQETRGDDAAPALGLPARKPSQGRIRPGFISADFREHPAAQLHWRQLAGRPPASFAVPELPA